MKASRSTASPALPAGSSRAAVAVALAIAAVGLGSAGCGKSAASPLLAVKTADVAPVLGRVGLHGMIVFGPSPDGSVYLASIPSYSPPNDVQFVWKAKLETEAGTDDYVPKKLDDGLYTLEPETFSLDQMTSGKLATLEGNLYIGNFQESAKRLTHGMRVQLGAPVLAARTLDAHAAHADAPHFVAFGTTKETFLVHVVTGAPDYDQVLLAHVVKGVDDAALAASVTLTATRENDVDSRLRAHAKAMMLAAPGNTVQLVIDRELSCLAGDDFSRPCPR